MESSLNTYKICMYFRVNYLTNRLHFTRCDVFCDLLQYTRTGKCNQYLFYTIKILSGFIEGFLGHEKRKTSPLT